MRMVTNKIFVTPFVNVCVGVCAVRGEIKREVFCKNGCSDNQIAKVAYNVVIKYVCG